MENKILEQKIRDYFRTETQGKSPSSEWWDRSINRLETPRSYQWWQNLIPKTRLAWVLLPVILILIGGTVYGARSLVQEALDRHMASLPPGPGVHYIPSGKIYFDELPDSLSQIGETVGMKILFTNFDEESRTMLNFPPQIKIESRNLPFEERTVRTFPAGQEQIQLGPGESKEYQLAWDQRDDSGQQVSYGWYEIRAMVQSRRIEDTRSTQGAGGRITRVLVMPAGGVMEGTLDVKQSQTVNGVTVNLEKVELLAQKANITTFIMSQEYDPENRSTSYMETEAEYRVDNEYWKPAMKEMFGTYQLAEGVRHVWDLDPVPQGSRELILRVNRINDWEGPWEFKVPLH